MGMINILESERLIEDDLPQNDLFNVSVQHLAKLYESLQNLEVDYVKIAKFIYFKVDDIKSKTKDIYLVSSDWISNIKRPLGVFTNDLC